MRALFQKIKAFVQNILSNVFNKFRAQSEVVVKVTANIKTIVESPFLDMAVAIIPGEVDNIILAKLRKHVPDIAVKVAIAHNIIQANDKNSQVIGAVITELKLMHPEARKSFWVIFSAELNVALSDGELTFSEAVILAQLAYNEFKHRI